MRKSTLAREAEWLENCLVWQKKKSPSIIFLDEIDAIGAKRLDGSTSGDREVQRTLMQLLSELDGFDNLEDVKIVAATNRPDYLR